MDSGREVAPRKPSDEKSDAPASPDASAAAPDAPPAGPDGPPASPARETDETVAVSPSPEPGCRRPLATADDKTGSSSESRVPWRHAPSRRRLVSGLKWLIGAVAAAAIGVPITGALTSDGNSDAPSMGHRAKPRPATSRPAIDPFRAGVRISSGYGPARPAFRCARPTACDGPKYVVFNSYINNPRVGDERPFLAVKDAETSAHSSVVDAVTVTDDVHELIFRAFIDNNTFQHLPGTRTEALNTKLRLALPKSPVYQTYPTAYLRSSNAKPRTIWDTVSIRSRRPMTFAYVRGSTRITRRAASGRTVEDELPDGVTSSAGLALGSWKADFVNSAYVTLRVRVNVLSEPVRNPLATRGIGGKVINAPAQVAGRAREPVGDSMVGDRFRCQRSSCLGPPFPELNAYENHPLLVDEADFVRGRVAGGYGDAGREIYRTVTLVQPGDQIEVRISVDNGGDPASIGAPSLAELTARDVRVRVLLPTIASRNTQVTAYLDSATTQPATISDGLPVRSTEPVRLHVRPRTVAVLTAEGVRPAGPKLFRTRVLPADERWGLSLGDLPPSFSQVVYVVFYLKVSAAVRDGGVSARSSGGGD